MCSGKQISLAVATLLVLVVEPYPDGQIISHSPLGITADTSIFKIKPEDRLLDFAVQPSVYCGVTVC